MSCTLVTEIGILVASMNTVPTHSSSSCSACGTSPVNHTVARISNIVDEIIDKVIRAPFSSLHLPYEEALTNSIQGKFIQFFSLVGLIRFSTDATKALSGRSELIWQEALRRGIRMEQIMFWGRYLEQYRAQINGRWFYFESLPVPPWLPQRNYSWVDDKFVLAHVLEKEGIPVPKARLADSWKDAERAFNELTKPVIIKPRIGSRGRHTTTNITTLTELRAAYDLAREIARELVIEEHLFGSVCRATVVGGKLVGFFRGDPPKVQGDGVQTVAECIEEKNAHRDERLGSIEITDDLISCIARQGYTLASVLPHGVDLDLSAKTGRFYGGMTNEMLPEVHPHMHTVFEKVAALIATPVAGFDLITTDPTRDPDTTRWGIIECNSLPFIDLHYYAFAGEPNDIAPHIWDLWAQK
jgi:cyanophycin synthetase